MWRGVAWRGLRGGARRGVAWRGGAGAGAGGSPCPEWVRRARPGVVVRRAEDPAAQTGVALHATATATAVRAAALRAQCVRAPAASGDGSRAAAKRAGGSSGGTSRPTAAAGCRRPRSTTARSCCAAAARVRPLRSLCSSPRRRTRPVSRARAAGAAGARCCHEPFRRCLLRGRGHPRRHWADLVRTVRASAAGRAGPVPSHTPVHCGTVLRHRCFRVGSI